MHESASHGSASPEELPLLHYSVSDGVMHIVLDRPPVNAIDKDGLRLIRDTFNDVNHMTDVSTVVVSSSNSRVFCAGADYAMLADEQLDMCLSREAMLSIYECPVPIVVAARGAAIGGGALFFLGLADLVIGGPGTRLSHPAIDLGAVGGTKFLTRLLGQPLTRKVLITGCAVTGGEMHAAGAFANYVPDDEILRVALACGKTISSKHFRTAHLLKQSLLEPETIGPQDSFRVNQQHFTPVGATRADPAAVTRKKPQM